MCETLGDLSNAKEVYALDWQAGSLTYSRLPGSQQASVILVSSVGLQGGPASLSIRGITCE
jgi:hypothetical protein